MNDDIAIQPAGFLLELSPDWIVRRASENVHHFLGESHVTLIDEPLGRFVQAQPLHDLRNLFARLSSTTGIARAYRVRLTDDRDRFDIAFQLSGNSVVLEAVPSPEHGLGEKIGSVGGLIEGLDGSEGTSLCDGAVRRMRALTGFDRAQVYCSIDADELTAVSSRGQFEGSGDGLSGDTRPTLICSTSATPVPLFPRRPGVATLECAVLRAPTEEQAANLRGAGVASSLTIPIRLKGKPIGWFRCDNRSACKPSFETHAAAELFAQGFAMQVQLDRLRSKMPA